MADENTPTGEQNSAPAATETPAAAPAAEATPTPEAKPTGLEGATFEDGEEEKPETDQKPTTTPETETPASAAPADTPAGATETPAVDKDGKPINQDSVDKKINTLTFQKYEEQRKREAAEAELAETKAKLDALKKDADDIVVPPMPDTFDPEYEKKIGEREAAIKKQAQVEYEKQVLVKQQADRIANEQKQAQEAIQQSVDTMYNGAKTLGFKEEEFKKADLRVSQFINNPQLAKHLLDHEKAPLIVTYLAGNATMLEKIATMDPIAAAVFIATEVVPKADALKPAPSDTPAPLDIDKGRAAVPQGSPFLNGVTFE